MVKRVLDIVYQEVRGLHQAAYVLALFAIASQLLALVRDRLLAHQFGAGAELDIYYAAFRIPDLLFVLFASSLSVYVLIPFVSRAAEEGAKDGRRLLSQVFTVFLVVYTVVAGLIYWFLPHISPLLFPGIGDQESLVELTRILLLQPFLLGLSSLLGVITQLNHRFVLYAISPIVYNVGIIIGIVALYPTFGVNGLGVGVLAGALMHLLVQWPFVRRNPLRFSLTTTFDFKELKDIFSLSIPRALTLSMQQLTMLALFGFASVLAVGSVSVFQFAYNLYSVPLSIIGVSYSVAAFPVMSELWSKGNRQEFNFHILTAFKHIIFWSVPAIALIVVLRAQVVRVILGSGAFDWADTRLTAAVLAILSLSLLAQAISLVAIRAFYAGGRTMVSFVVVLIGALTSLGFAFISYQFYVGSEVWARWLNTLMRVASVDGSEILALALGYALAVVLQAVILVSLLASIYQVSCRSIGRSLLRSLAAAVAAGLFAYVALNFLVEGVEQERLIGILIQGVLAGAAGVFGAAMTYSWLDSPELYEIYTSFQKRLLKTDVMAPQEDVLPN